MSTGSSFQPALCTEASSVQAAILLRCFFWMHPTAGQQNYSDPKSRPTCIPLGPGTGPSFSNTLPRQPDRGAKTKLLPNWHPLQSTDCEGWPFEKVTSNIYFLTGNKLPSDWPKRNKYSSVIGCFCNLYLIRNISLQQTEINNILNLVETKQAQKQYQSELRLTTA